MCEYNLKNYPYDMLSKHMITESDRKVQRGGVEIEEA